MTLKATGRAAAALHVPDASRSGSATPAASGPAAYTAAFLQSAYDTTWLSANNGGADTVAIVDAYGDPSAYSDMEAFRSGNGLPGLPTCASQSSTGCFEVVNQNGSTSGLPSPAGGWAVEESLDIDAVSSICPLCKIMVVEARSDDSGVSPDLEDAVLEAAQLGANQISLSWGSPPEAPDATHNSWPFSSVTSAAILAAAGDNAYPGTNVSYPAALASVTAIGGTTLNQDPSAARGVDESAWSKGTCSGSICGTESGCDTSQGIPSYQSSVGTGCSGRAYNDISADANPSTGLEIYDSQSGIEGCDTSNNWCIVGGTSLATPLTAGFEAVTGVTDKTPSWTYSDASSLNDVVSGSDGTCPSGWSRICNAGTGWDGPTGNGSINGALVAGGPGISNQPAATISAGTASVSAEIDPNDAGANADATYDWQYGRTQSYGVTTPPGSLTAGTTYQNATTALSLAEPCVYHFRVVATNALGTSYGYDHTVTSGLAASPRINDAPPTVNGTAAVGDQLSAQPGTWSGGYDCGDTTYQWERSPASSGSSWTPISGATAAAYTPTLADAGQYLEVVVTETNSAGPVAAASAPSAQVPLPMAAPSDNTTPTTPPTTPPTTTVPEPETATTTSFYRCAATCTLLDTHGAATYTPQRADYGRYIRVVTTVSQTEGNVIKTATSTRWIGPVTAPAAGSTRLGSGARAAAGTIVRGSSGAVLARARVIEHRANVLTLRVARASAATHVWAYVMAGNEIVSCTPPRSLKRAVSLRLVMKPGQAVRLVAVRT